MHYPWCLAGSGSIDVLIVDDDSLVRSWIAAALRGTSFRLVGEAATAEAALDLLRKRQVQLLLVDQRLGRDVGTELVRSLRREDNRTPAILMTAAPEQGLNERAREAGAQGTLRKTAERQELLACLTTVAEGGEWFDIQHPRRPAQHEPPTAREREVLVLVARGLTNEQISSELGIGAESVKTYLGRLYVKLGVRNRSEAVDAGHRLGLLGR